MNSRPQAPPPVTSTPGPEALGASFGDAVAFEVICGAAAIAETTRFGQSALPPQAVGERTSTPGRSVGAVNIPHEAGQGSCYV